jgi:hypothetical protein
VSVVVKQLQSVVVQHQLVQQKIGIKIIMIRSF